VCVCVCAYVCEISLGQCVLVSASDSKPLFDYRVHFGLFWKDYVTTSQVKFTFNMSDVVFHSIIAKVL